LVDKNYERKYISVKNSDGILLDLPFYELNYSDNKIDSVIIETIKTFTFEQEKNKLHIESIGVNVIEFLLLHFSELFEYDYTKRMEDFLDEIIYTTEDVNISIVQEKCQEYYNDVMDKIKKFSDTYSPREIKTEEDKMGRCLGISSENECIYIKKGKYGTYVEWTTTTGEINRVSISKMVGNRPLENITLLEVEKILKNEKEKQSPKIGHIRNISKNINIQNGKYGYYIYFKSKEMKKGISYNLSGFTEDVTKCNVNTIKSWIKEKYNIY
jgi:DNA topoisomerase-1